jgi:hypothetical protein
MNDTPEEREERQQEKLNKFRQQKIAAHSGFGHPAQPFPKPERGRRVIQVSSSIDSVGKYFILALCDDGSLWQLGGLYEGTPHWSPFITPPLGLMEE